MKIAIIGGTGEFGRVFARIFREEGHEVVVTGRDVEKGEKVAKSVGVEFSNANIKTAKESDVVIISVPIESTREVIKEIAPHLRSGSLLADFTSVKIEPCRAMEEFANEGVEIVGMHPMFGPRITTLEGQTVILTPIRASKWIEFLTGFFERHKTRVFISTPEEHDRIMSVVQGLTHFAYITAASTIKELDVDVKFSRKFASPVYELMLDLIARIVGQNPRLYASIQMRNPEVKGVHEAFIKEATRLQRIVRDEDMKGFVKTMASSAKALGDVDAAMGRSDKAISALNAELKRLKESIGEEVAVRHIYSGAVHLGKVKSIGPESVTLTTPKGDTKLKLSNVELLDDREVQKWKAENFPVVERDFSVLLPKHADEEILRGVVENSDDRIVSCDVVDVYEGEQIPKDKKSITLNVKAVDFKARDFEKISGLLEGIGGVLR
ncbi:MAG: prephenate dehydrogenase [Candidatus Hydrothermarchaeales archaeon]